MWYKATGSKQRTFQCFCYLGLTSNVRLCLVPKINTIQMNTFFQLLNLCLTYMYDSVYNTYIIGSRALTVFKTSLILQLTV